MTTHWDDRYSGWHASCAWRAANTEQAAWNGSLRVLCVCVGERAWHGVGDCWPVPECISELWNPAGGRLQRPCVCVSAYPPRGARRVIIVQTAIRTQDETSSTEHWIFLGPIKFEIDTQHSVCQDCTVLHWTAQRLMKPPPANVIICLRAAKYQHVPFYGWNDSDMTVLLRHDYFYH